MLLNYHKRRSSSTFSERCQGSYASAALRSRAQQGSRPRPRCRIDGYLGVRYWARWSFCARKSPRRAISPISPAFRLQAGIESPGKPSRLLVGHPVPGKPVPNGLPGLRVDAAEVPEADRGEIQLVHSIQVLSPCFLHRSRKRRAGLRPSRGKGRGLTSRTITRI